MNKKIKSIICALVVFSVCFATCKENTYAHSLEGWANEYRRDNISQTYSFSISNVYHIDGNNVNYYWKNSTIKSKFPDIMNGAVNIWGGLITAKETTAANAELEVQYDPDVSKNRAYACILKSSSSQNAHYTKGGVMYGNERYPYIVLTYGNANNSSARQQETMAHELGHIWGINDIYDDNDSSALGNKLDSMYSNKLSEPRTQATRHDKNAMYICLKNSRFLNWDNTLWDQTAPRTWSKVGILGDVTMDGVVNLEDSQLALKASLGIVNLTDKQKKLMDYNGDLKCNNADAKIILNVALGVQ